MTEVNHASKIAEIIEAYPADRRFALAAMQDMQHAFNYIPEEGLTALAKHLGCPVAQLYSMATFYKALSLTPKGEHIIKICNGTACHLRGSMNLKTELQRNLGIEPGQTTEDGLFSVELVNCLGSCALGTHLAQMIHAGSTATNLALRCRRGTTSCACGARARRGR